ncbi:MAG: TolC family protein [Acidiferrobacterales bacterium]
MNKLRILLLMVVIASGFAILTPQTATAESFTLHQTLRRVMLTYPTVEIARLQARRAQQDIIRARSVLGWNLGGQVGANHDLSQFSGTPSDTANLSAELSRQLASGGTIGLGGSYNYVDSSFSFGPTFPNPSRLARVDANYRKPLAKGTGNPLYNEGLKSAKAGERIARANEQSVRDGLATQTIELFYLAALIQAQMETAKDAVARARKLKSFIRRNERLGLSEEKDLLQAEAQLQARIADYDSLVTTWEQQRTLINRLLGRPRGAEFTPVLHDKDGSVDSDIDSILEQAKAYSPDLHRQLAQIEIAESQLVTSKDLARSTIDLVLGLGYGNRQGPAIPPVNQSDYAAGVRLEFHKALDNSGNEAVVTQAMLDRSIALREAERIRDDVKYNVTGLIAGIRKTNISLASQRRRVIVERKKVDEAFQRYRSGRTDTTQLILFENDYQIGKLARERHRIELLRQHASLELLRGILLQDAMMPAVGNKGEK